MQRRLILDQERGGFGRLLQVETVPVLGALGAPRHRAILLSFDVARYLVEPDPDARELQLHPVEAERALPDGLESAAEVEPWWKLLGARMPRAWAVVDPEGRRVALDLQLRDDGERPWIVTLTLDGNAVRVRDASKEDWQRRALDA